MGPENSVLLGVHIPGLLQQEVRCVTVASFHFVQYIRPCRFPLNHSVCKVNLEGSQRHNSSLDLDCVEHLWHLNLALG